jgi:organic hydroperoxide reductase OsmC/OhrA
MKILYTTEAVVEGGRAGRGRSSDGRLGVELSVPKELGGEGVDGTPLGESELLHSVVPEIKEASK